MPSSNRIIFAFIVLTAIINGCSNLIDKGITDKDVLENNIGVEAYFCPEDNCSKIITNIVNSAENSVHCAFFDLDLKDLITAIVKKSLNADVKVVIDHGNYDGQIKGPGIKVVKSRQYMHNKFCIIDNNKVITGSMNPTNNGANLNNNNLIIIDSKYLAENYEDEFDELWGGIYASGNKVKYNKIDTDIGQIENYFCPEDCQEKGVNKILSLVREANKSVKVAIFSFTHEELADELIKADINGLDVAVLVERTQRNGQNSQYTRLKDFGVDIKVDGNKNNMHNKFIVIDEKIVITGSPNFSFSGYNRNDENMLMIYNRNLAQNYVKEFDRMFDKAEII